MTGLYRALAYRMLTELLCDGDEHALDTASLRSHATIALPADGGAPLLVIP